MGNSVFRVLMVDLHWVLWNPMFPPCLCPHGHFPCLGFRCLCRASSQDFFLHPLPQRGRCLGQAPAFIQWSPAPGEEPALPLRSQVFVMEMICSTAIRHSCSNSMDGVNWAVRSCPGRCVSADCRNEYSRTNH